MNKVLVTGGGHLLDYHVIKRLNERGIRPRSLVLPPPDSDTTHIKRLSVDLMGEITAPSDLAEALQGVDTVLHMAYKVKPGGTLDAMRATCAISPTASCSRRSAVVPANVTSYVPTTPP